MVLPIQDPSGTWIPVVATWRAATPKRTLALAKASESPISWVCGRLRVDRQGPRIDPISVMSDRMWVLDLENPVNATFEHLPAESVHGAPWRALGEWLDSAVHDGLLRASDPADLQQQLEQAGWAACVKRVEQLRKFSQQSKEEEGFDSAAKAWLDLGILVSLLSEESE